MTAKENEQTRDASDDELGEFLGDIFKSHRQLMARRQRSDDEAQQFLEELLSNMFRKNGFILAPLAKLVL